MLTISQALTTPEYVLSVQSLGYYTRIGGDVEGRGLWFGEGAAALGLSGEVNPNILRNLFEGKSPDGQEQLVRRGHKKKRQGGWDLTFSAPKSVTMLWALGTPEQKAAVEAAHMKAVEKALKEIEALAGFTRISSPLGKEFVKVKLTFGGFTHATSRESDPDLHTHCLLVNLGILPEGRTGFVYTREIFRMKMLGGLIYRQTLAHELQKSLGIDFVQKRTWMEVAGIPEWLCARFSKRRRQVLEHLEARGMSGAQAAAESTKATRKGKEMKPSEELHTQWREEAFRERWIAQEDFDRLPKRSPEKRPQMNLHAAIDSLLEKQSHFTERQFLQRALERNQANAFSYDQIREAVTQALGGLIDLGVRERQRHFTTRDVVLREKYLLDHSKQLKDSLRHIVPERRLVRAGKNLSASQLEGLRQIAGKSGQVAVLQGYAGTGKSSLLAAAKQAWEKSGFQVVGAAYSGRAAEELQNASGIQSHTVDRLLFQWAKSQSRVRPLNQKSILVVDEAGMLDSVKYGQLLGYVEKSGAKLVLVGDEKQLPPIGSASMFTELGAVLGRGELTEIRRQRNPLLRMVVEEMADGSPRVALKLLQRDKLLRLSDTPEQVRHQLVQDWFRSGDPKSSLMLAVTREDARDLNLRAQTLRKNHGQLGFGFFSHNDFTFHMGDRVLFRRNDRLLGVVNGSQGELVAFEPFKRIATFQLDNGKKVFVPVDRYRDLELAYCRTTFSAQGATVDNTFILWNPEAQSREGTYVQASRSRFRSQFYLTHAEAGNDFKAAIQSMEKSVAKDLAITKAREHGKDLSPSL